MTEATEAKAPVYDGPFDGYDSPEENQARHERLFDFKKTVVEEAMANVKANPLFGSLLKGMTPDATVALAIGIAQGVSNGVDGVLRLSNEDLSVLAFGKVIQP